MYFHIINIKSKMPKITSLTYRCWAVLLKTNREVEASKLYVILFSSKSFTNLKIISHHFFVFTSK
jgi:hypothetical protein